MRTLIKHWFTSRDGVSFSLTKLIGFFAGAALIVQFIRAGSVDFQGFAIGISALIAALAVKYAVDAPEAEPKSKLL